MIIDFDFFDERIAGSGAERAHWMNYVQRQVCDDLQELIDYLSDKSAFREAALDELYRRQNMER